MNGFLGFFKHLFQRKSLLNILQKTALYYFGYNDRRAIPYNVNFIIIPLNNLTVVDTKREIFMEHFVDNNPYGIYILFFWVKVWPLSTFVFDKNLRVNVRNGPPQSRITVDFDRKIKVNDFWDISFIKHDVARL